MKYEPDKYLSGWSDCLEQFGLIWLETWLLVVLTKNKNGEKQMDYGL